MSPPLMLRQTSPCANCGSQVVRAVGFVHGEAEPTMGPWTHVLTNRHCRRAVASWGQITTATRR